MNLPWDCSDSEPSSCQIVYLIDPHILDINLEWTLLLATEVILTDTGLWDANDTRTGFCLLSSWSDPPTTCLAHACTLAH